MATETPTRDLTDPHAPHEHAHPSDGTYIITAVVLAVLTAAEVATYYIDTFEDNTAALVITLIPIMVVKFAIVAAMFMHLRFDDRILRRVFVGGVILAAGVYAVMLTMFHIFPW